MEIPGQGGRQIIADIALDAALLTVPFLYLSHFRGKNFGGCLRELGLFSRGAKTDLVNSAATFTALFAVSIALSFLLLVLGLNDLQAVAAAVQGLGKTPLLLAYLLLVRVSAEEVFFRGLLVARIGVLPSALLFGLFHIFYGSVAEVIGAFVLGALLGWTYQANKNLFPNILAHMAYNYVAIMALV